jgi:uncharacterized OsmC-like protein
VSVESSHLIKKLAFDFKTSEFTVNSDVNEKLGGDNTAPNPHHYLEVSLASCTAITVIADKCPIHKFITRGAQIATTIKEV